MKFSFSFLRRTVAIDELPTIEPVVIETQHPRALSLNTRGREMSQDNTPDLAQNEAGPGETTATATVEPLSEQDKQYANELIESVLAAAKGPKSKYETVKEMVLAQDEEFKRREQLRAEDMARLQAEREKAQEAGDVVLHRALTAALFGLEGIARIAEAQEDIERVFYGLVATGKIDDPAAAEEGIGLGREAVGQLFHAIMTLGQ